MSHLLGSRKVRAVLIILGGLIIIFIAFGLGIAVGFQRAGFASEFSRNYYRNFYGGSPAGPAAMHGVTGTVIEVTTSTLAVKDPDNNEQSVQIFSNTVIREDDKNIAIENVMVGDHIAVIGEPNDQGQVVARFVRVFGASSTMPLPPSSQNGDQTNF